MTFETHFVFRRYETLSVQPFKLLSIANHLLLHTSFMTNLGLFYGKMGSALFFVHYAKYTNNSIYDDFVGEILDEIYEDIHTEMPVYFSNGLSGIAWG